MEKLTQTPSYWKWIDEGRGKNLMCVHVKGYPCYRGVDLPCQECFKKEMEVKK